MSDPNRLLDEGANGFEHQLLSAALTEKPAREAQARLLASLGLVGATTTAMTAGAGATGALSTATKAWALKSFCAVALVAAAGAAAVRVVGSSAEHQRGAMRMTSTVAVPRAVGTFTAPAAETALLPMGSSPAQSSPVLAMPRGPSAPLAIPRRIVAAPRASAAPERSSEPVVPSRSASRASLTEETALLDAARSALRGGRVTQAIAQLDEYARRFPRGLLEPEASAVRVEALLASGDRDGAEAVARALVATAPKTFAAHRVQALLNW